MIRRIALVLVTAGLVCAAFVPWAGADPAAPRVFDRTYVCTNTVKNGVRTIEVGARRGFRERGEWRWHANVGIGNAGGPQVSLPPNNVGLPGGVSDTNWSFGGSAGLTPAQWLPTDPVFKTGVSYTTRKACAPSPAWLALTPNGLDGGPASYFSDEYECDAPRRVVVRLRAVFATPTSFMLHRRSGGLRTQQATAPVRDVRIAVRTEAGKPFLYLEALASGKARIFTAKGCTSQ